MEPLKQKLARRAALALLGLLAGFAAVKGIQMLNRPLSPSSDFDISADELVPLKRAAEAGDCSASYRVAHYFSFVLNKSDDTIRWLRVAAQCKNLNAKTELAYMLMATGDADKNQGEIDRLIEQIEELDARRSLEVKEEVRHWRTKNGSKN